MNMYEIIEKKKNGQELTTEEIQYFVSGYTAGDIPDYQASALLMAIWFEKMNRRETFDLTRAMTYSGDVIDLSSIKQLKVDKHSTGGVGDSTSLALAPILGALGLKVAKMSGRGLGFSGGTLDKLESIPGVDISVSEEDFIEIVNRVGCAIIGQTSEIVPADKLLYRLRDVTATVDCMPLIASSIMSKKIASGSDVILLDVKYGSGAFMKTPDDAVTLAKLMVDIGEDAGRKMGALITSMDQPLSNHCGNTLEILGILEVLSGGKSRLYSEITLVCSKLLILSGKAENEAVAKTLIDEVIASGKALDKFYEMVAALGGNVEYLKNPSMFEIGKTVDILAKADGYISEINTASIGISIVALGGGREKKEDEIINSVGVIMNCEIGSCVKKGDVLLTIYHEEKGLARACELCENAFVISENKPADHKIAVAYVDKDGVFMY
ncbi:MAG: thymidine phosphorylase [Bacillota bacterium]